MSQVIISEPIIIKTQAAMNRTSDLENFLPEITARYQELRKSILAPESLLEKVENFVGSIPRELYLAEERVNPKPAADFDGEAQIREYIAPRIAAMDSLFSGEDKTA